METPGPRRLGLIAKHLTGGTEESSINRQIFLAEIPKGHLSATHFVLRESPLPVISKEGQVLVKILALTIGAGQRAGLQGSATYAGAMKGDLEAPMSGSGAGLVVASRHPDFNVGDLVAGPTGWQTHALVHGKDLTRFPPGLAPEMILGGLGTNGLTAYFGLLDIGRPQSGETVVVSGAGGSVGHLVGQIAKIQGCRVVGVAGSTEKCQKLVNELGFDAAVNYKSPQFRDELKAATPKRIDVYFDNTGGIILQSALFRMNLKGRIVCCGNVSQYDTATPGGGPRGVPGLLVNNQIKMEGFIVYSYKKQYAEARRNMSKWIQEGKLKAWTTKYNGLQRAPQAFVDLLGGVTRGSTIVAV